MNSVVNLGVPYNSGNSWTIALLLPCHEGLFSIDADSCKTFLEFSIADSLDQEQLPGSWLQTVLRDFSCASSLYRSAPPMQNCNINTIRNTVTISIILLMMLYWSNDSILAIHSWKNAPQNLNGSANSKHFLPALSKIKFRWHTHTCTHTWVHMPAHMYMITVHKSTKHLNFVILHRLQQLPCFMSLQV